MLPLIFWRSPCTAPRFLNSAAICCQILAMNILGSKPGINNRADGIIPAEGAALFGRVEGVSWTDGPGTLGKQSHAKFQR
jgi:hypothetical protein